LSSQQTSGVKRSSAARVIAAGDLAERVGKPIVIAET